MRRVPLKFVVIGMRSAFVGAAITALVFLLAGMVVIAGWKQYSMGCF
jgi:hypothetical protein